MRFALTTFDNPYDPFEQFTQWFMFDEEKGYHTTAYLGRIARCLSLLAACCICSIPCAAGSSAWGCASSVPPAPAGAAAP